MNSLPDSIDAYLDELLTLSRCEPSRLRRILAETEDHLRESARLRLEAGVSRADAEREAIAAFGTPKFVAARFGVAPPGRGRVLLAGIAMELVTLAMVALLAVGLSGVALFAIAELKGTRAAVRDGSFTVNVTGTLCSQQGSPGQPVPADAFAGCTPEYQQQLALDARRDELQRDVLLRLVTGGAGTAIAAVLFAALRRTRTHGNTSPTTPAIAALSLFGLALVLFFAAYDSDIKNNAGAGMWLSGGLAALTVATACAIWFLRVAAGAIAPRGDRFTPVAF